MGRSWRNFFRRSKKQEEPLETAVEAPVEQPTEAGEPEAASSDVVVETRDAEEEAPVAEEPVEEIEAPVREVPFRRVEDDEADVDEPEAVEPEVVEPETVQAREAEVVEPAPVESAPEDGEPEEPRGWFGRRLRRRAEDEETVASPEPEEPEVVAPEVVEPEPVEPEPVQAREVVEPAPVEEVPEDEEIEESRGWFGRLRNGLSRSRESFVGQLNAAVAEFKDAEDEEFWERVEEILITSDVGVPTTAKLVAELEEEAMERNIINGEELR